MFQPLPADDPTLSLSYPPHHVVFISLAYIKTSCWQ